MKRQIKFQLFDKDAGVMRDVLDIDFEHNYAKCKDGTDIFHYDLDTYPMRQYIGLKDKNGKEAYEGDIIKTGNSIGVIVYKLDSYDIEWKVDRDFWNEHTRYHVPKGEIIGNIYEHPQLIEVIA